MITLESISTISFLDLLLGGRLQHFPTEPIPADLSSIPSQGIEVRGVICPNLEFPQTFEILYSLVSKFQALSNYLQSPVAGFRAENHFKKKKGKEGETDATMIFSPRYKGFIRPFTKQIHRSSVPLHEGEEGCLSLSQRQRQQQPRCRQRHRPLPLSVAKAEKASHYHLFPCAVDSFLQNCLVIPGFPIWSSYENRIYINILHPGHLLNDCSRMNLTVFVCPIHV